MDEEVAAVAAEGAEAAVAAEAAAAAVVMAGASATRQHRPCGDRRPLTRC